MLPFVILFEPLSECMVIGALAAWSVGVLFQWDGLGFYLIHILFWFIFDWILLSIVQVKLALDISVRKIYECISFTEWISAL